jgi:hypothetical protein
VCAQLCSALPCTLHCVLQYNMAPWHAALLCSSAQHHRQVLQRRVPGCWRRQVAASDAEWQALAAALCFNKRRLLDTSLRCWRSAVASQAAAVAAARDALQGWRHRNERATCAAMLRAWRQVTVQRSALHSLQQQALAAVRLRRQRAVLRQWAREGAHCRRLRRASAALSQLRRRWQTWHNLARWRGAAAVLAGRRCSELRALVLTRACLGCARCAVLCCAVLCCHSAESSLLTCMPSHNPPHSLHGCNSAQQHSRIPPLGHVVLFPAALFASICAASPL